MNESEQLMLIWAAAIVLPMLPAWVLFKYLPSVGDASGPLKGLNVKFGGAFAGYLILFLSLLVTRPADAKHFHLWTLTGNVVFQQPAGAPEPSVNGVLARVVPPRLSLMNQGVFEWEIPVPEDESGTALFPTVEVDLAGYRGVTVPLGANHPYGVESIQALFDAKHHVITLKQPITLVSDNMDRPYVPAAPLTSGGR